MNSRRDTESLSPDSVASRTDSESQQPVEETLKDKPQGVTSMGLKVLALLAVQNSSKNLLLRFVMKEKPKFLTSAAVIGSGTFLISAVHVPLHFILTSRCRMHQVDTQFGVHTFG